MKRFRPRESGDPSATLRSQVVGERGYALVAVIVVTTLLLAIGVVGIRSSRIEIMIARNQLHATRAIYTAEAGLEHGLGLLKLDGDGFTDELQSAGVGGGLTGLGSLVNLDSVEYRFRSFGSLRSTDGYYVRVVDNHDETSGGNDPATDVDSVAYLESTGRIGNAERTVRLALRAAAGASSGPGCAILVNGNLKVSGLAQVTGSRGCAHTNQNVEVSGDTLFQAGLTASGDMDISGNPTVAGDHLNTDSEKNAYEADHDDQPLNEVPSVRPLKFGPNDVNLAEAVRQAGGYRLDANCRVYGSSTAWTCSENPPDCTGGTVVANLSGGGMWNGWECSSDSGIVPAALWKVPGSSAANGAFFIEGWVDISGDPGNSGPAWEASLIAMNTINVAGSPKMTPFTTSGDLRNLLLVSGNDIGLSGTLGGSSRPGGILAHQQIKNNGNFTLNGFLMSEDGKTTWAGDPAPHATSGKTVVEDHYELSGNPVISYSGFDTVAFSPTSGGVDRLSWVELRRF